MAGIGLLKNSGLTIAVGSLMAFGDYSNRRAEGKGVMTSAVGTTFNSLIPMALFQGPRGWVYEGLYRALPIVPSLVAAGSMMATERGVYMRKSALPFSNYGYQPTMGAIQAMQRGLERMSDVRGVTQAHASLASQALRR